MPLVRQRDQLRGGPGTHLVVGISARFDCILCNGISAGVTGELSAATPAHVMHGGAAVQLKFEDKAQRCASLDSMGSCRT